MVVKNCIICKKEYKVKAHRFATAKYCSWPCRSIGKQGKKIERITRICLYCEKNFHILPNLTRRNRGKYCSKQCMNNRKFLHPPKWHEERRQKDCDRSNKANQEAKKEVIKYYGGVCSCCGVTELVFLNIDHIDPNTKIDKTDKGSKLYRRLRRLGFPMGYQVLCFNCNFAKSNGGCSHKKSTNGEGKWSQIFQH